MCPPFATTTYPLWADESVIVTVLSSVKVTDVGIIWAYPLSYTETIMFLVPKLWETEKFDEFEKDEFTVDTSAISTTKFVKLNRHPKMNQ